MTQHQQILAVLIGTLLAILSTYLPGLTKLDLSVLIVASFFIGWELCDCIFNPFSDLDGHR